MMEEAQQKASGKVDDVQSSMQPGTMPQKQNRKKFKMKLPLPLLSPLLPLPHKDAQCTVARLPHETDIPSYIR